MGRIDCSMSEKDIALLDYLCKAEGVSRSEWIRNKVNAEYSLTPQERFKTPLQAFYEALDVLQTQDIKELVRRLIEQE